MFKVRRTNDTDLVTRLHEEIFPADTLYKVKKWINWIVLDDNNKPVGFCQGVDDDNGTTFMLSRAGIKSKVSGKGLHKRMIRVREQYAKKNGYKWIITYVKNNNIPSFCNLIKMGYEIYTPNYAYGGIDSFHFRKYIGEK